MLSKYLIPRASKMAVLGVQIVITMVMASVMTKIGPFMSLARWILTSNGLVRYLHPSDEELKPLEIKGDAKNGIEPELNFEVPSKS